MTDSAPTESKPKQYWATLLENKARISIFVTETKPATRVTLDGRRVIWKIRLCPAEFTEFEQALAQNQNIQQLMCISNVGFVEVAIRALKVNTSVRSLKFDSNKRINKNTTVKIIKLVGELLQHNSSLTDLDLMKLNGDICDNDNFFQFTNGLRKNSSLRTLAMPRIIYQQEQATALIQALNEQKHISIVKFPSFYVSTEGMKALALFIKGNVIKDVEIRKRMKSFVADDLLPVFEALKETTSVIHFHIRLKKYWTEPIQPLITINECNSFAEALSKNKSLTHVNINWNAFGTERISIIFNGLRQNKSITEIKFSENNNLDDQIGPSIGTLLEHNKSLTELNLKDAKIHTDGCKYIAMGLMKNKSIISLNMEDNEVGIEGCKYLADALKINRALSSLSVRCYDPEGLIQLSHALVYNHTLRFLGVKGMFDKNTFDTVYASLQHNKSLHYLGVYFSDMTDEQKTLLDNLLKRNRQFRKEFITNMISILIQIGRSKASSMFPAEMWLKIFKYISCSGVPSFKPIAEQILMRSDVSNLNSLLKRKIARVKAKAILLESHK